jgi:hypothetical protein
MLEKIYESIMELDNNEKIRLLAEDLFNKILEEQELQDNEKILVVDLLNAMLNNSLYKS